MTTSRILFALGAVIFVAASAGAGTVQTTYSCSDMQGATTLTNVPTPGATCEALYTTEVANSADAPSTAVPTISAPSQGSADAKANSQTGGPHSTAAKTPDASKAASAKALVKREAARAASARRESAIRETADAYSRGAPREGNPAVSRRYLKTDRATYIQQNGMVPR